MKKYQTLFIGIISIIGLVGLVNKGFSWYADYSQYAEVRDVKNVESAQKFLIGTWVFADPLTGKEGQQPWWERMVIKNDGTVTISTAAPSDSKWSNEQSEKYDVITKKFADTGERYFAMKIENNAYEYIIRDNEYIVSNSNLSSYKAVFKRGDKNLDF